ncbi:MAG: T9SS type A sorting domain-containing protein, partial [Saprospiraceae bacterium]|nr:T9SS type A sorting domain-containing protein [Bacteroidia bacterium]NNL91847.1 T9SS type A sorting domain-containing protein [Saprospiraceae bacterium]
IEEEITLLGLKYSLVTEFTSFVAVDSSAVTNVDVDDDDPDDPDDGLVEVEEIDLIENLPNKSIIKLLGTVISSDRNLKLKLENIDVHELKNLKLHITDMNGRVLKIHELDDMDLTTTITLDIRQLPSGIFFITLNTNNDILDTEKFIIMN